MKEKKRTNSSHGKNEGTQREKVLKVLGERFETFMKAKEK